MNGMVNHLQPSIGRRGYSHKSSRKLFFPSLFTLHPSPPHWVIIGPGLLLGAMNGASNIPSTAAFSTEVFVTDATRISVLVIDYCPWHSKIFSINGADILFSHPGYCVHFLGWMNVAEKGGSFLIPGGFQCGFINEKYLYMLILNDKYI